MSTTEVSRGIYHIVLAHRGGVEVEYMTNGESHVTILPPGARPPTEQEWQLRPGKDADFIIQHPTNLFPSSYLTYQSAPGGPLERDRVLLRVSEFPLNEWHFVPASEGYHYMRVAGSELGIAIGPEDISPPFLMLSFEDQLKWRFIPANSG